MLTMDEDVLKLNIAEIASRLHTWNIDGFDLKDLSSVQSVLGTSDGFRFTRNRKAFFWFIISIIFGSLGFLQWPLEFTSVEPCLLPLAAPLASIFRPPVNCRICQNVSAVDRVSKITRDVFEYRYAYSGRPLVVTDAMADWSAVKTFSFEFFRSIYSLDSPVFHSNEQQCQFFPYRSNFRNLTEVFGMSDDRANLRQGSEPWYVGWSNCDGSAANVLRSHYYRPYFLPDEAESSKTDWIFMGSPHFGADLHIDNVKNPSWQAQITGRKLWTLEPPPECYSKCINRIEVTVEPGEIIVLDTNQWFHSTTIVGHEMSITIGSEYD